MNELEQIAVLRRLVITGGRPFRMNGMVYWIADGIIYRDFESIPEPERRGQRIGHVEGDDYIMDNSSSSETETKRNSNFAMKPSVRLMLDVKAKSAGFESASAYLEYLIENA